MLEIFEITLIVNTKCFVKVTKDRDGIAFIYGKIVITMDLMALLFIMNSQRKMNIFIFPIAYED